MKISASAGEGRIGARKGEGQGRDGEEGEERSERERRVYQVLSEFLRGNIVPAKRN
jgi:hypothetical protein